MTRIRWWPLLLIIAVYIAGTVAVFTVLPEVWRDNWTRYGSSLFLLIFGLTVRSIRIARNGSRNRRRRSGGPRYRRSSR